MPNELTARLFAQAPRNCLLAIIPIESCLLLKSMTFKMPPMLLGRLLKRKADRCRQPSTAQFSSETRDCSGAWLRVVKLVCVANLRSKAARKVGVFRLLRLLLQADLSLRVVATIKRDASVTRAF